MTNSHNATPAIESKSFADFGVNPEICEALASGGITSPFPIQELTLPLALAGADIIGQARTGTGKTLAFGIPMLQRVDSGLRQTQALVIVPTRELCVQVTEDLTRASAKLGVTVVALYGGKPIEPQAKAAEEGVHVVVGTPGRLLDLMRRGSLRLEKVQALVLDEADEMLDLGFLPDVEQLIQATAEGRQTLLFSATMPSAVVALARRYMHKPTFLRADVEEVHIAPKTQQHFLSCHRMDKPAVLARILTTPNRGLCVVFTRTKRMADVLAEELREHGVKASPIHSDLRQEAREKALERFRSGKITVLVATEVAARGLDIDDVTHVVNYDCPDDEKMYLHRIGRTGRAGADGVAITMAVWNELARLEMIKKALDITDETHEVFSTSPILDELFALPPQESRKNAAAAVAAIEVEEDDEVNEAKALLAADAAADTTADTAKKQSAADDSSSKRRRRGGRGRSKAGAASEAPVATDAPAKDVTPAKDTEAAPAADSGIRRTRTRTRAQASASPAAEEPAARQIRTPAEPVATAAKTSDDSPAEDGVRRRTRTRTTGTAVTAAEAKDAGERASRAATPRSAAPRASSTRSASSSRQTSRSASGKASSRDGAKASADSRSGRARTSERSSERTGDRNSARSGQRSNPRNTGRPERGRTRQEHSEVDTEVARAGGRPVIARPLTIQHLP